MPFAPRRRQHVLDLKANKAPPNADTKSRMRKRLTEIPASRRNPCPQILFKNFLPHLQIPSL